MLGLFQSKEKRMQAFLEIWRPILEQATSSMPSPLPTLSKRDAVLFIDEWNERYQHADTNGKTGLAVLAYRVDIHRYASGMLIDANPVKRLAGIRILGHMRDETAWPFIANLAQQKDSTVSLAALSALFQINARRAIDEFAGSIIDRRDWPLNVVKQIIDDVDDKTLVASLNTRLADHYQTGSERAQSIIQTVNGIG